MFFDMKWILLQFFSAMISDVARVSAAKITPPLN
jgi:hypothetical protein